MPVRKVLQLLESWKSGPLSDRRDSKNVDYIRQIITNDSLYDVQNKERDHDLHGWLNAEVNMNAPTSSGRRWSVFSKPFTSTNRKRSYKSLDELEVPQIAVDYLEKVSDNDWDVFHMHIITDGHSLYYTCLYLLDKHDLINKLRLPVCSVKFFLRKVESLYRETNPYHNSIHACDVLQTVNLFIEKSERSCHMTDLDRLVLLIAACVHDIDHPGVNNNYERLRESDRALLYNDQSILENYHCSQTFMILKTANCNILEAFSREDKQYFRDSLINLVLATDISKHFAIVGTLQNTILSHFDPTNKDHIGSMMKMFLKCADVGNPAKDLPLAKIWAERVTQEFYLQGDLEKEHGLTVSSFMDRTKPNLAKSQTGFINYIAKPLFDCLAEFDSNLQFCLDNVCGNLMYWDSQQ
ncbi:hypothetical protein AKO1_014909, partial [Acrasis kona]